MLSHYVLAAHFSFFFMFFNFLSFSSANSTSKIQKKSKTLLTASKELSLCASTLLHFYAVCSRPFLLTYFLNQKYFQGWCLTRCTHIWIFPPKQGNIYRYRVTPLPYHRYISSISSIQCKCI